MIREHEYPTDRMPGWVRNTFFVAVAVFALIGLYDILLRLT